VLYILPPGGKALFQRAAAEAWEDLMSAARTADILLEGLNDLGIDYIFANLGTDHAPIIESLAEWQRSGRKHPPVIICPHENVAVHMAGGYALATGRGQAVLVHVDAGTANAAMALHNLFRTRIPVLLMAGRAPYTMHGEKTGGRDTYVHFVQDPYDMAGIVRPFTKWEYSLPSAAVTKEVLRRAHSMMQSEPQAPVYLSLPREVLAEPVDGAAIAYSEAKYGAVRMGGLDPESADKIAVALMAAKNPIAVTAYLGRNHAAVAALDALARECGIRVAENAPVTVNIPQDSPCYAGLNPGALLKDADLGMLLDIDVPWIPADEPTASAIKWIQIDVDPLKAQIPMWGFATDMRYQADCAIALKEVLAAVKRRADDGFRARVKARVESWAPALAARKKSLADAAAKKAGAMSVAFVCATLNARLTSDDIIVNEAVTNSHAVLSQLPRTKPGTYFAHGGGGLGGSGGMALGIRLAQPDKRVIQIVGDGVYHFSNPDAVYAVAQQFQLPIFTIVLDNGGWRAVKASVLRVYPKGSAEEEDSFNARLHSGRQGDVRRFDMVAAAFGAHGENVTDAGELPAAIERCLAAIKAGRAAVMTVQVTRL
jgi:acetolactate synthase-1/2/3 large subunit